MASQIGAQHNYTDDSEATSPELATCPQCKTQAVPRGITSSAKVASPLPTSGLTSGRYTGHCPYCGHVYGDNSLLVRKVRNITVTGAGGATTIATLAGTLQLSAAILPTYADNQAVTWSVVNGTGTATISAAGLLTASHNGTVTAEATAADGSGIVGFLVVTITNNP